MTRAKKKCLTNVKHTKHRLDRKEEIFAVRLDDDTAVKFRNFCDLRRKNPSEIQRELIKQLLQNDEATLKWEIMRTKKIATAAQYHYDIWKAEKEAREEAYNER